MSNSVLAAAACATLCVAMIGVSVAGHGVGRRRRAAHPGEAEGGGAVEASVFALLGLLIAFNFAGAYSRLDTRRQLIVEEANAIGTAYLRLDLLPADDQAALRESFRAYVDSRVSFYQELRDRESALEELAEAAKLQNVIWSRAVAATHGAERSSARMLLLPALNEMIDITTTRTVAVQTHPPILIVAMLFALALICAALTGLSMAKIETANLVHVIGFAAITALMIYVILDIDYPRVGLVRLDAANDVLVQLRESLGP